MEILYGSIYKGTYSNAAARYFRGYVKYEITETALDYILDFTEIGFEKTSGSNCAMTSGSVKMGTVTIRRSDGSVIDKIESSTTTELQFPKENPVMRPIGVGKKVVIPKSGSVQSLEIGLSVEKKSSAWSGVSNGTMQLAVPPITNPAIVSVSDNEVSIGDTVQQIHITSDSSDYEYGLYYQVDNNGEWSAEEPISERLIDTTDMGWVVPKSIIETYLPNNNNTNIRVNCYTYYNDTSIGSTSTEFVAYIPDTDEYLPVFNDTPFTVVDEGDIPSAFSSLASQGKYLAWYSNMRFTVNVSGAYGASISSLEMEFGGRYYRGYQGVINGVMPTDGGNIDVNISVTDSRGRTKSINAGKLNIVAYNFPLIESLSCSQSDGLLTVNVVGTVSSVENLNGVSLDIYYRKYGTTDTYKKVTVYNNAKVWNINKSTNINDASILEDVPYDVTVYLSDLGNSGIYESTVITNLLASLSKSNYGYSTFVINPNSNSVIEYGLSYLQYRDLSWTTHVASSDIPNSFVKSYRDNVVCGEVGYTKDKHVVWKHDGDASWRNQSVPSNIINITTAFDRVIVLCDNGYIYWVNPDTNTLDSRDIGSSFKFIVGNKKFMIAICETNDSSGIKCAYITDLVDGELTPIFTDSSKSKTLNDFDLIKTNTKFISTDTSIIGMINTEQGWKLMRSPTVSLR